MQISKLSFNPSELLQRRFKFYKRMGVSVKLAWEFACNYVHRRIQKEQAQTVKYPECNEIITHVDYIYADIDGDGNLERYPLFDEAPEGF